MRLAKTEASPRGRRRSVSRRPRVLGAGTAPRALRTFALYSCSSVRGLTPSMSLVEVVISVGHRVASVATRRQRASSRSPVQLSVAMAAAATASVAALPPRAAAAYSAWRRGLAGNPRERVDEGESCRTSPSAPGSRGVEQLDRDRRATARGGGAASGSSCGRASGAAWSSRSSSCRAARSRARSSRPPRPRGSRGSEGVRLVHPADGVEVGCGPLGLRWRGRTRRSPARGAAQVPRQTAEVGVLACTSAR